MTSAAPALQPSALAEAVESGFEAFLHERASREPVWLTASRREAMARFRETGLPSVRDEDWRQTPIGPITRTPFRLPGPAATTAADPQLLEVVSAYDAPRIVLVDGRFSPELSALEAGDGVRVASLAQLLKDEPDVVHAHLGRALSARANAFAALNTAFVEDGALVLVPRGTVAARPIHVIHHSTTGGTVTHPRLLVIAETGSQALLIERHGGRDGEAYLSNSVAEFLLEDGAALDHYKVQREGLLAYHVATQAVRQGRDSRFESYAIALGGAIARQDVDQSFRGQGGECMLGGLFLAGGGQLTDTHTRVEHAVPHCSSRQLYKGIVDGMARGVFVGRVYVAKDAQKTDAQQTNKNLLLSRQALVHSVPQLEILADDVKCKHGSTTGQIDPTALFYLRSRGIGEAAARSLLVYAFASDVVARIKVESLRKALGEYLRERLPSSDGLDEAVA
jgi:Fe-S cluster assembly protein SufD